MRPIASCTVETPAPVAAEPVQTPPVPKSSGKSTPSKGQTAATGTVVVAGDAREVRLDGKVLSAGSHPLQPGRYKLTARFPDLDEAQGFADVTVVAGRTVTVRCSSAAYTCSAQR